MLVVNIADAAPKNQNADQEKILIRKMYNNIEMMRHEMNNHEAELRTLGEKFVNMEDAVEEMRKQLSETVNTYSSQIKGSKETFDNKILSQESTLNGFVSDLQKLKNHADRSSSNLEHYQKQITQMEHTIELQSKNIDSLKAAVKSLMAALGENDESLEGHKVYRVQSGDSLGVIAQKHNTTIRAIKELNGLTKDTIIVGQKLKIPE
jgi:LysM repeat protein